VAKAIAQPLKKERRLPPDVPGRPHRNEMKGRLLAEPAFFASLAICVGDASPH
jgi:hypothetical protein